MSYLRANGLLWEPTDANRPLLPFECLQNKWVHIIGDSLSWHLFDSIIHLLSSHLGMHMEVVCYTTLNDERLGADAPRLVRDHTESCLSRGPLSNGYRRFVDVVFFKDWNITLSRHWFLRACIECPPTRPLYVSLYTLNPWSSPEFLNKIALHQPVADRQASRSFLPSSTPLRNSTLTAEMARRPEATLDSMGRSPSSIHPAPSDHHKDVGNPETSHSGVPPAGPARSTATGEGPSKLRTEKARDVQRRNEGRTASRRKSDSRRQHRRPIRRESSEPFILPDGLISSPEFLYPLRPGLAPTHVIVNAGLHHIADTVHLDLAYGAYVAALLRDVIA
eukprot:Opistho-2@76590